MTQAGNYIDSQLCSGGRILAHWLKLKAHVVHVTNYPRKKRKPDLASNGKILASTGDTFYTNEDGSLWDTESSQG